MTWLRHRHKVKRWWVTPVILALLIADAATLTSGSIIASIVWPVHDFQQRELVFRAAAWRLGGRVTTHPPRRHDDDMQLHMVEVAVVEYHAQPWNGPLWASTGLSGSAIRVTPVDGERLSSADIAVIGHEMRARLVRRYGPSAAGIGVGSPGRVTIDLILGTVHNAISLVAIVLAFYTMPTMFRTIGATYRRLTDPIRPRTPEEKRADKLRRGVCPSCTYDIRGLAGRCPECGHAWTEHEQALVPERTDADVA